VQRAALAEATSGNMGIHIAYCVRAGQAAPAPAWDDPDSVPVLRELDGPKLAATIPADGVLRIAFDGLTVPVALPRLAQAILARVDGQRSIGAIGDELAQMGVSREAFAKDFAAVARAMERVNRLLLAAR